MTTAKKIRYREDLKGTMFTSLEFALEEFTKDLEKSKNLGLDYDLGSIIKQFFTVIFM